MARTDFHAGRPEILFHHCLTCGRESNSSPSPLFTSIAPYGKWNRSARVNVWYIEINSII